MAKPCPYLVRLSLALGCRLLLLLLVLIIILIIVLIIIVALLLLGSSLGRGLGSRLLILRTRAPEQVSVRALHLYRTLAAPYCQAACVPANPQVQQGRPHHVA